MEPPRGKPSQHPDAVHPPDDPAALDSNSQRSAYEETVESSMDGHIDDPDSDPPAISSAPPAQQAASPPDSDLPRAFGRYEVRGLLGQGGFGAVYLGYDTQLDRQVAIKAPRLDVHSAKVQNEFFTEARQLAKLHHPGIVSVFDVGIDGTQCFIVSSYLEGENLDTWLRSNHHSWQQSVQIVASIADALAHAHAQRVVHRDLKPANVIMTDGLTPVIVDFGLALSDVQMPGSELGVVAGTPSYMSPEQARGEGHRIDGRTDIHALGVILYRMLTGRLPYQSRDAGEVLRQIREDEPQPPRQLVPDIPRELERICLKAMAKRVGHRFTTAGDMAEELLRLIQAAPTRSEVTPTGPYVPDQPPPATTDVPRVQESPAAPAAPVAPAPPATKQPPATPSPPPAADSSSQGVPSARSTSHRSREALRRRITLVLCGCDVFTSEDIVESLDMEEQQEVLLEFQNLCRTAADDSGGTVFQETTDGLLICFGYPIALEDASLRAVRCGRQLLEGMEGLNRRVQSQHQTKISAFAAVHCDQAIVQDKSEEGGGLSIVGQVLNVVNQLENVVEPESLVVTDDVHRLLAGHFDWESLWPQRLRGVGQKKLFRVTGERESSSRIEEGTGGLTPLIGRDLEVGLLQERWEQATEGMGQVVLLIGEAGLGKSRLVHMLKEHVRHASDLPGARDRRPSIVEWFASPQFHSSSLKPVIDYFENRCGFERGDTASVKLDKLVDQLAPLNFDGDEQVALLASLLTIPLAGRFPELNLDPQRQKERTFELIGEWLRELSYDQPVLFVIEDLHWVDPTTLEFLTDFVSQGLNESILTLLTFRPEFVTPWQSMAHQTQIALNRLTRRQIGEMVMVKAGAENVPQNVIDQIAERTDGVPLFVEEFTRMVVESDSTIIDPEASVSTSGSFRQREIPATLQDLLMARLDRIDANIEVAQFAAAIGREFSQELIRTASPFSDEDLQTELDKLVAADVLLSRGRPPRTRYQFKHALIQDAAYGSLVKQTRRTFHQRIAETLEAREDTVRTQPELLALHFTEAGDVFKAIEYWDRAGTRSLERRAHQEAIHHLRCGLELLALQPESPERFRREIHMHTTLGVPLQATIGYSAPEVEETYARAHELCGQLGLTTEQFPVLYGMFRYYMLQAKYPKARELGEQLLQIAEQTHTPHYVVAANRARGGPPVYEGRHSEALPFLEKVVDIEPTPELRAEVDRYDVVDPWIAARSYLSWAHWLLGYADRSLEHSEAAVRVADGLDHSFSTALALSFSQWVHQFRRDVAKTRDTAEKALAISREHGFAFWYGWCRVVRGWAIALQGQHEEALTEIRQGIVDWRAQGSELGCHYYYVLLAEACLAGGRFDEALAALDEARQFAADTGEGFYAAEIPRLRGKALLKRDPSATADAEACFREALGMAAGQQAKSLELRAARSLARLFKRRGDTGAARDILSPVYEWFTEGFETYDLKESKKLLESLSG